MAMTMNCGGFCHGGYSLAFSVDGKGQKGQVVKLVILAKQGSCLPFCFPFFFFTRGRRRKKLKIEDPMVGSI
jgi:hypothetical protein